MQRCKSRYLALLTLACVLLCAGSCWSSTYTVNLAAKGGIIAGQPTTASPDTFCGYFTEWGGDHIGFYKFELPVALGERIKSVKLHLGDNGAITQFSGRVYFKWIAEDNWSSGSYNWNTAPITDYNSIIATGDYAYVYDWAPLYPVDLTRQIVNNEGPVLAGQTVSFALYTTDGDAFRHDGWCFNFPSPTLVVEAEPDYTLSATTECISPGEPNETWFLPYGGYMSTWAGDYIGYYKFRLPVQPGQKIVNVALDLGAPVPNENYSETGRMYVNWGGNGQWLQGQVNFYNAPVTNYQQVIASGLYSSISDTGATTTLVDTTSLVLGNVGDSLNGQYVTFAIYGTNSQGVRQDGCLFRFDNPRLRVACVPDVQADLVATEGIASGTPNDTFTYPGAGYSTIQTLCGTGDRIGFLKYKLPNIPGVYIESASLSLGPCLEQTQYGGRIYVNWLADDSWTQGSVSWENAPTTDYNWIMSSSIYATVVDWAAGAPADVTSLLLNDGPTLNGQYVTFAIYATDVAGGRNDSFYFLYPTPQLSIKVTQVPPAKRVMNPIAIEGTNKNLPVGDGFINPGAGYTTLYEPNDYIGYYKFMLPNINGAALKKAELSLGIPWDSHSSVGGRIYIQRAADDSWVQGQMSWGNAPIQDYTQVVDSGVFVDIMYQWQVPPPVDITSMVAQDYAINDNMITLAVFGTDFRGQRADRMYWLYMENPTLTVYTDAPALDLADFKKSANQVTGKFTGIVTGVFGDSAYVETEDRSCGIRVYKPGYFFSPGFTVTVTGEIKTDMHGERYIDAFDVEEGDYYGEVMPLGLVCKNVGGTDWNYDPSTGKGQRGVTDGTGLNNIGLLVTTWGVVTYPEDGEKAFYVDDGSGTPIKCIVPDDIYIPYWECRYGCVTGISSCEAVDGGIKPVIKLRIDTDLQIIY